MSLQTVVLDEHVVQRGSQAQRIEWEINIRELLAQASCALDSEAELHILVTEQQFVLDFRGDNATSLGSVVIDRERLSDHITEYLDIVRQITSADSVNQMEALDMAKKVTHDRAGRVLKRALRELGFDLETSRRLFTLLLSLSVDTTRIPGVYGHREPR